MTAEPTVLVVEDAQDVATTYELWLSGDYDVRVAHDGPDALEMLDDAVDVVLLDRMMPEMSGDEVLAEIRARDVDCRVAMVSAVDPDFDVVEMGFDEYVTKPPDEAGLRDTIERLLDRADANDALQTYHSLIARRSALEAEKARSELEASDEYAELVDRIERTRAELDDSFGDLSSDAEFVGAVRDLTDGDAGDREER